jgi:hypothetical protein
MAAKPQPRQPGKPGKPHSPARSAAKGKPGDGLMGWLGRQVGHVKQAVQTDVTKPVKPKKPGPQARRNPASAPAGRPQGTKPTPGSDAKAPSAEPKRGEAEAPSIIVYRQDKIEEAEMPHQPGVKLRRTIIDEVIVVKKTE